MSHKIVFVLALVTFVNAGFLRNVQTLFQPVTTLDTEDQLERTDEFDTHPQYNYSYDVQDFSTGDNKSQDEARDGDVVRGQYTVVDSDGLKRIVDYTADSINGFNAIVQRKSIPDAEKRTITLEQEPFQNAELLSDHLTPITIQASPIRIAESAPTIAHVTIIPQARTILTGRLEDALRHRVLINSYRSDIDF